MDRTMKNINTPATPLNNVHFGLVFYCPLNKVNPCRIVDPVAFDGGFFFINKFMKGKDMKNKGQEVCDEITDIQVQAKEWENRSIREDARKFEQIIKNNRMRLGLEASHA